MINTDVFARIEQVSEVLACAQDYDGEVLTDLHRWFNHLFRQSCKNSKLETAAVACAASRIVEKMLIDQIAVTSSSHAWSSREELKIMLLCEVDRTLECNIAAAAS